MGWILDDIDIENSIDEIAKRKVLVDITNIEKLNKYGIKYYTFSDEMRTTKFIRQGKKPKRFNDEDIKIILEDLKTMSIRNVARKYNCSTSTIQYIKKGVY